MDGLVGAGEEQAQVETTKKSSVRAALEANLLTHSLHFQQLQPVAIHCCCHAGCGDGMAQHNRRPEPLWLAYSWEGKKRNGGCRSGCTAVATPPHFTPFEGRLLTKTDSGEDAQRRFLIRWQRSGKVELGEHAN